MIVFDLDKTLRDTTGSELHVPEDITLAKNWVKWQEWVNANGTPITKMVELYVKMNKRADTLILTSSQFGTLDWLTANDIPAPNNIIERDAGDNRHGFDYKREFIDSNLDDIELWVDDDKAVCNYALSLGVRVMLVDAKAYSPDEPKERGIVIMDTNTKYKIAITTALMALDCQQLSRPRCKKILAWPFIRSTDHQCTSVHAAINQIVNATAPTVGTEPNTDVLFASSPIN